MNEETVGINQLKAHLSKYLQRVKAGETVLITDHGQPVGRIVPVAETLEDRLQRMAEAGLILWSGRKLAPISPVAEARGERTVADLLIENRA